MKYNNKTQIAYLILLAVFFWATSWQSKNWSQIPLWLLISSIAITVFIVFLIFWVTHFSLARLHKYVPFEQLNPKHWLLQVLVASIFSLTVILMFATLLSYFFESKNDYGVSVEIRIPSIIVVILTITCIDFFKRHRNEHQKLKNEFETQILKIRKSNDQPRTIELTKGNTKFLINTENVAYVGSKDKITNIVLFDKSSYFTYDSLKALQTEHFQNPLFFLANRNFLIHKRAIDSWKRTEQKHLHLHLSLFPDLEIVVNKNNGKIFLDWLNG